MLINTKFDAGQDVFILHNSNVIKSPITRVTTEKSFVAFDGPLITYYFSLSAGTNSEIYRYENEVGATITELIRQLAPREIVTTDVTDDLDKLQQFVRDSIHQPCDAGSHETNSICRVCEARKLLTP